MTAPNEDNPGAPPGRVDTRFLLANERTLLAWVRTALALLAVGGGVQQLTDIHGRTVIGVLLAVTGVAAAATGAWRYRRTVAALVDGRPAPTQVAPTALAGAVAAVGVVLAVALVVTA